MQLPTRRQAQEPADLRTVQVIEGDEGAVADVVAILRKAGCVVDSTVELTPGRWEITARARD